MRLSGMQILIVVTTLVVLAVFTWLVTRTPLGRRMRACEQDLRMASLLGIDTDRTISAHIHHRRRARRGRRADVPAVLRRHRFLHRLHRRGEGVHRRRARRYRRLPGAVLGGLLIGLIEVFWSAYFAVEYKDVAAFSILIVVLIFLPTGILGRAEVEKV